MFFVFVLFFKTCFCLIETKIVEYITKLYFSMYFFFFQWEMFRHLQTNKLNCQMMLFNVMMWTQCTLRDHLCVLLPYYRGGKKKKGKKVTACFDFATVVVVQQLSLVCCPEASNHHRSFVHHCLLMPEIKYYLAICLHCEFANNKVRLGFSQDASAYTWW